MSSSARSEPNPSTSYSSTTRSSSAPPSGACCRSLERGVAVIVNRPFAEGALFRRVRGRQLPGWAAEFDCRSWAQFFLKFIVSHPATTCAIPATSKLEHLVDNLQAGRGRLPDAATRSRMARLVDEL